MILRALAIVAPLTMITACGTQTASTPEAAPAPATVTATPSAWTVYQGASVSPPPDLTATGTFMPYGSGSSAITYDPKVVPPGSNAIVVISSTGESVRVQLAVSGLLPRRPYGAHLHTQPCAAQPDAAGPHYQHEHDPAAAASPPSVDPSYANPANEVWLDFTTGADGRATATSTHSWDFPADGTPRSLIIHERQTKLSPGVAGTAGARIACLTVPQR